MAAFNGISRGVNRHTDYKIGEERNQIRLSMLYPCCIYAAIYAILKLFYMSYDYQHKGDTAPSGARNGGSRRPPQIPVSVRGRIKCGVTSLIQSSTDASGAVQHLSYSPPDGDGGLLGNREPPVPRSSRSIVTGGYCHWPPCGGPGC